MTDMSDEAERRIEAAFAAGEATLCLCRVCGADSPTDTYRVDGDVIVLCDNCSRFADPKYW